jgi:hypothetical protein
LGAPVPGAPGKGGFTPPAPSGPPAGQKARGEEVWQTYEKATGKKWGGGGSDEVKKLLTLLQIGGKGGSASTNLALQKALRNPEVMNSLREQLGNAGKMAL